MPRYVILEHDWPTLHWDLLLEAGGVLRAWRLLGSPESVSPIPAEANFDHRKLYLDYEGPISDGRGSVKSWDAGMFKWIQQLENETSLELTGRKLRGQAILTHDGIAWQWHFRPSSY